jgi:DAK2 domain fusion protein YloV
VCQGSDLQQALAGAAAWLEAQAEHLNRLNVFPVPDGDTGTNMSLTLRGAADAARQAAPTSVEIVARAAARGALMAARGNSGVILSQLIRGFSHALQGCHLLGPQELARALEEGARAARAALAQPVEGTMLSVASRAAEAAREAARRSRSVAEVLEHAVFTARVAVAETPQQLPLLRQAGVVDAGGEGYRLLLEGLLFSLRGEIESALARLGPAREAPSLQTMHEVAGRHWGYCTEFLVSGQSLDPEAIRASVEAMGESVVVVGDADLVRVHLHTDDPGRAIDYAATLGRVEQVKIENMDEQHAAFRQLVRQHYTTPLAVVAMAPGAGLANIVRSLGAIAVQSATGSCPSTEELLVAIQEADAEAVVLLPSDENAILVAEQVAALACCAVHVVPTTNVVQVAAAILAFNPDDELEANLRRMRSAAAGPACVEVCRALRTAEVDGLAVVEGHWLALLDGKPVACHPELDVAVVEALATAEAHQREVATVYLGKDTTPAETDALVAAIAERYPNLDVEALPGGQPHYSYIIGLE